MLYNPLVFFAPTSQAKKEFSVFKNDDTVVPQEECYQNYYGAKVDAVPSWFTSFQSWQEPTMMIVDLVVMPLCYLLAGLAFTGMGIYSAIAEKELSNLNITALGLGATAFGLVIDAVVLLSLLTRTAATIFTPIINLANDHNNQNLEEAVQAPDIMELGI